MEIDTTRSEHKESHNTNNVCDEEITVDWRGRPSNPNKHGGMRAASFVLGNSSILLYFYIHTHSGPCQIIVAAYLSR